MSKFVCQNCLHEFPEEEMVYTEDCLEMCRECGMDHNDMLAEEAENELV